MKTVEDAVRELGGDWRKGTEPGGDYLWAIGDLWQALDSPTGYFGEFICTREEFDACKTKLEGKSMKLIDILARELEEWPEGVDRITQDSDGELNKVKGGEDPHLLGGYTDWASGSCYALTNKYGRWVSATVAEDQSTAIITREQWEKARRELQEHSHEVKADDWPPINSKLVDGKTGETTHVWDGENLAELPDGLTLLPDPDFSHEWRGPEDGLPPVDDPVNSPRHYTRGGIEAIDAIEAQLTPEEFRGFCKGNVAKYIWRERHKGGSQSLQKAAWYLDRLREEE